MRRLVAPVPGARIDTESIFDAARAVSSAAETHASTGADASVSWLRVGDGYSAPESQQLMSAMSPVRTATDGFAGAAQAVARALTTFALEAEAAQAKQVRATSAISSFRAAATSSDSWQDDPALVAQNTRLTAEAAAAERELCEAEEACARAIAAIPVDAPAPVPTSGTPGAGAPLVSTGTWGYPDGVVEVALNPLFFLGKTPEDVTAWWDDLSAEAQAFFIAALPGLIGNRDGIPAVARDAANRVRLSGLREPLVSDEAYWAARAALNPEFMLVERDIGLPEGEEFWIMNPDWDEEASTMWGAARDRLDALDSIDQVIGRDSRYLLVLDMASGMPKSAVSVGNPDEAEHIGVLVPGTGSTVSGKLITLDRDAEALRDRAGDSARAGAQPPAVISWMDYEAPQSLLEATSREPAAQGARELAQFTTGLASTNGGAGVSRTNPHISVLGHSYGAVVSGDAAAVFGSKIDDVVAFGAPGAGAAPAPGVGRYSMLSNNDPIKDYHQFLAPTGQLGEVPYGRVVNLPQQGPVTVPSNGWIELPVVAGLGPGGEDLEGSSGHSEYLFDGTRSQFNMVQVIMGNPERAVAGP